MKIIILGKRDQMGTTPNIRVKGVSRLAYNFLWDPKIRHYAYEPKSQKEADDLFRAQGKIYRHMFFSAWLDEEKVEETSTIEGMVRQTEDIPLKEEKKPKKTRSRKKAVA
jgi:hypothetical protein